MARVKAFGHYVEGEDNEKLRYVFESETGDVILAIEEGQPFFVEGLKFNVTRKEEGMKQPHLAAVCYDAKRKFGIANVLGDNVNCSLAVTAHSALNGLYKRISRYMKSVDDRLTSILKKVGFEPHCVITTDTRYLDCEVELKSDYNEECNNFKGKNCYTYHLITDCQKNESTVINPACVGCKNKLAQRGKECTGLKKRYFAVYGGSYYITLRRNVITGQIQILTVVVKENDNARDLAAKALEEFIEKA